MESIRQRELRGANFKRMPTLLYQEGQICPSAPDASDSPGKSHAAGTDTRLKHFVVLAILASRQALKESQHLKDLTEARAQRRPVVGRLAGTQHQQLVTEAAAPLAIEERAFYRYELLESVDSQAAMA